MINWIKSHKWVSGLVVAVLLVGGFALAGGSDGDSGIETAVVERMDVEHIISETGRIEPSQSVDLTFETSGRVTSVTVSEGDAVASGVALVFLANADQRAALASARASLAAEQARLDDLGGDTRPSTQEVVSAQVSSSEIALENARDNLERVRDTQDENVEDARETLLSNDLQAYFEGSANENSSFSYESPTISGTYTGEVPGEYTIELYSSDSESGYSFHYTWTGENGEHEDGIGTVSASTPRQLGNRGLYIEFPDDFARGVSVEWVVPVPNTRSSSYVQVRNAYESALDAREDAIEAAEEDVEVAENRLVEVRAGGAQTTAPASDPSIRAAQAAVEQARARVQQAEIALDKTTLFTPFAGMVTDVSVTVGEVISPSAPAVSLISDAAYEITVDIPEADIVELDVGDSAEVTFDAYDDTSVEATVTEIAPQARQIEGVTVVAVTLQVEDSQADIQIRSGLSADVEIAAETVSDVLAVPGRAVNETSDETFVRVVNRKNADAQITLNNIERRAVTTGLRGSDGYIEIADGLEAGDVVVTFLPEAFRDQLSEREGAEL